MRERLKKPCIMQILEQKFLKKYSSKILILVFVVTLVVSP